MATGYIFNGFGRYEANDKGEPGITIMWAGVPFWLPYEKVTPIPNFTLREVDHDKSTPQGDSVGELVYRSVMVPGQRVVEELCDKQVPASYREMGIVGITGKSTGRAIEAKAGWDSDGTPLTLEVPEREATEAERASALAAATLYKETVIKDYFQSKRERMTGGRGRLHPDPQTRLYMEELDIEDIDDVSAHAKNNGLPASTIKELVAEAIAGAGESNAEMIAEVVKQMRNARKDLPIAEIERRRKLGQRLAESNKARAAAKKAAETVETGA